MMTVAEVPIASSARIAERIAFLCYRSKRCQYRIETLTTDPPTPWTVLHREIDQALTEYETCTEGEG